MTENQSNPALTSEQKTGFVLLLIFGLLAIGLGMLQIRNNIYSPFIVHKEARIDEAYAVFDEATRLQRIDTDQDGIHDFDELNFFGTSPYIPDTDSDGIGDKQEIDNGTDPLCPEGDVCGVPLLPPATTNTITSPLAEQPFTPEDIIQPVGQAILGDADALNYEALLQSPERLRELLLSTGGITQEQLELIDDATLVEMARQLFAGGTSFQQ